MRITLFRGYGGPGQASNDLSWAALCEALSSVEKTPCTLADCKRSECEHKKGSAWSPALFRGPRSLENAVSTHLLVYDLDHLAPEVFAGAIQRVAGLELLVLPTHSDRPDDRCVRLILPLSHEAPAVEFPALWARVRTQYAIPVDEQCKDISRLYFLPRAPSDAAWEPITGHGALVDVALVSAPAEAPPEPAPAKPVDMAAIRETLRASGRPELLRALAGEPLAEAGDRDRALRDACGSIAWRLGSETPVEVLVELLRPSVLAMAGPDADEWLKLLEYKAHRALESAAKNEANQRAVTQWALEESARAAQLVLPPLVRPEDIDNIVNEINKHYFVLLDGGVSIGRFTRDGELERLTPGDFGTWLAHSKTITRAGSDEGAAAKCEPTASVWIKHAKRRAYEGVELSESPSPGALNLWRGLGVKPAQGEYPVFRELLSDILCAGERASIEYLTKWCAWAVQHPTEVAGTAVVLKGDEGIGKGSFVQALLRIFGPHAQHYQRSDQVVGRFNGHLEKCCLLFADEAFFAGSPQSNNILKGMITEKETIYESKGYEARRGKSHLKIVMATNNEWAVNASANARRYFILEVSDARQRDFQWFNRLYYEMQNGGVGAWLYDLLQTDLEDWHPSQLVTTEGLLREKINSLAGPERWLYEVISDESYVLRGMPRPLEGFHATDVLYDAYIEWCSKLRTERPVNRVWFGRSLQKLQLSHTRGNEQPRPWGYQIVVKALIESFRRYLVGKNG